ncbi:MAG TPA: 4Fe-4S binding protein [Bacillota bacterium]|nr:4Fe-4S binding protein [Bacillota bacterium]
MKTRQKIRKLLLLISLILYPVTFFIMSPDLLLFGAAEGVMAGDVLFFGGLFIFSLFGGRLFCGWVCPAGALQECSGEINGKPVNNRWNWIKFIPFIPWLCFFLFLTFWVGGGFRQIDVLYKRAFGVPIVGVFEWAMYLMTVAIILVFALAKGKRGFCHFLCWVSPFMIIGKVIGDSLKLPAISLKTKPESCNSCGLCSRSCPMSLPVADLVKTGVIRHSECLLCASCIDSCPQGVIQYRVMSKGRPVKRGLSEKPDMGVDT